MYKIEVVYRTKGWFDADKYYRIKFKSNKISDLLSENVILTDNDVSIIDDIFNFFENKYIKVKCTGCLQMATPPVTFFEINIPYNMRNLKIKNILRG